MHTVKVYTDIDGNELSIFHMVRREPDWAAHRVQEGEKAIAEVERLKDAHALVVDELARVIEERDAALEAIRRHNLDMADQEAAKWFEEEK